MPVMRIWLDDERPAPAGWVHLKTAGAAIDHLETGLVTAISLDHDLGPPEAGTGYDVALWIETAAATGKCRRLVWAIHSANPVGIRRMEMAMRSADRFWNQACRLPDEDR